jgi:putative phage-type endonuclease
VGAGRFSSGVPPVKELETLPVNLERFDTRAEWLAARDTYGIGSSDVPIILGLSRYMSPLALYQSKLGIREDNPATQEQREWGLILEEPIAQRYGMKTDRSVIDPRAGGAWTIARSSTHPFMIASVDRFTLNNGKVPAPGEGLGVLEIKNAHQFMAEEWGASNNNEPPAEYQVQLQHQLAVTGVEWGSIAALIGGSMFVWADIKRDDALIAKLIEVESEFMARLEKRIPPPADGSDSTKAILRKLHPRDNGQVIELPTEAIEWHDGLLAAKEAERKAKSEADRFSNLLKQAIGDATVGVIHGGPSYTLKTQTRAEFLSAATEFRVLRLKGGKK